MAAKKKTTTTTPVRPKAPADWRASFAAQFPQFVKLIDGGAGEAEARQVFGDEVVNLILDVAQHPDQYDFTLESGVQAFRGRLQATPYYQNTSQARRDFDTLTPGDQQEKVKSARIDIASQFGDYFLTVNELDMLAKEVARSNLQGVARQQYIASKVGTRRRGREDVLATAEADEIRKIAKAYNYNPSDLEDQVFSAVTGSVYAPFGSVITADSIRAQGQQLAKAAYFHLAPQLDAGLTLEQIFSPYRQRAAQILERSDADISMSDPLYSAALNPGKNGSQMTLTEWDRMIRTDPRYGFQYTDAANKDATNLGLSIARMFGGIK